MLTATAEKIGRLTRLAWLSNIGRARERINKYKKNDNCEFVKANYEIFPIPVAAALWCGIPATNVQEELKKARPLEGGALAQATLRHPRIECLEPRIRAIHSAIDAGELRVCDEGGKERLDQFAYGRRHVYGKDLREWSAKLPPSERPKFLFDALELSAHAAITMEAYQSLAAERDTKARQAEQLNERVKALEDENEKKGQMIQSLEALIEQQASQTKASTETLDVRTENAYLNVLGALLECIQGEAPGIARHPDYLTSGAFINLIVDRYGDHDGVSKRNMEGKFAAARKRINQVQVS